MNNQAKIALLEEVVRYGIEHAHDLLAELRKQPTQFSAGQVWKDRVGKDYWILEVKPDGRPVVVSSAYDCEILHCADGRVLSDRDCPYDLVTYVKE